MQYPIHAPLRLFLLQCLAVAPCCVEPTPLHDALGAAPADIDGTSPGAEVDGRSGRGEAGAGVGSVARPRLTAAAARPANAPRANAVGTPLSPGDQDAGMDGSAMSAVDGGTPMGDGGSAQVEVGPGDRDAGALDAGEGPSHDAGEVLTELVDGDSGAYDAAGGDADLSCLVADLGSDTGWVARAGRDYYQAHGNSCPPAVGIQEHIYRWQAPIAGRWHFTTNEYCAADPEIALFEPTCTGVELGRVRDTPGLFGGATITRDLEAGEVVHVALRPEREDYGRPSGLRIHLGHELACGNGSDDDWDGWADCDDEDCIGSGLCPDLGDCDAVDLGEQTGAEVVLATPWETCIATVASPETYLWRAPAEGDWVFQTISCDGDTVLTALEPNCEWNELARNDDAISLFGGSSVELPLAAGESLLLHVSYFDYPNRPRHQRPITLRIFRKQPTETDCADGLDNDHDALPDCNDPECYADPECEE